MTIAVPAEGSMMFMRTLIVVVFPAPFAPINANALPSGTENVSPRRASWRLNFFHKLSARITCGSPPPVFRDLPIGLRQPRSLGQAGFPFALLPLQVSALHLAAVVSYLRNDLLGG